MFGCLFLVTVICTVCVLPCISDRNKSPDLEMMPNHLAGGQTAAGDVPTEQDEIAAVSEAAVPAFMQPSDAPLSLRYCAKCGKGIISEKVKFCSGCGALIEQGAMSTTPVTYE